MGGGGVAAPAAAWSARSTGRPGSWSSPSSCARSSSPRCEPVISDRRLVTAALAAVVVLVGCQPVATVPKPARGGTAGEALVGPAGVPNPPFESLDSTTDRDSVLYHGPTTVCEHHNR